MTRWLAARLLAFAGSWCVAGAAAVEPPEFTPAEVRRILSHGPWPPPAARDAGNAFAADVNAIALGQQLFFDTRLSPDRRFACASCHAASRAFAEVTARSLGREPLARNSPSLWNASHARWFGWDGAADSLWSQAIRPLLDPREMASTAAHVARVIAADPALSCRYRRVFSRTPGADPDVTLVDAAKSIGAFVGTLVSARTPFDTFRDALGRGDRETAARYPVDAQRGLRVFIGHGQCSTCHVGAMFSNGEFGDIGLPFFIAPGVVDPGRHGGIEALRASRYNLLSIYSDAPAGSDALKTRHVELQHRNFGEFKVPSLRNVADTAPYMHDGQLATLDDVVRHYSDLDLDRLHADGEQILKPLGLAAAERDDLVAFLRTLSDPRAAAWQAPAPSPCRAPPISRTSAPVRDRPAVR